MELYFSGHCALLCRDVTHSTGPQALASRNSFCGFSVCRGIRGARFGQTRCHRTDGVQAGGTVAVDALFFPFDDAVGVEDTSGFGFWQEAQT